MKLYKVIVLVVMLIIGLAVPATAGKPIITGTIDLYQTNITYGDSVTFVTTVDGKLSRGYTYVSVVCIQNGRAVYQASSSTSTAFVLVDQGNWVLSWNGEAANCFADFRYRVDGIKPTILVLDSLEFDVASIV